MAVGENHLRPHLIHFNRCKNVLLDGFKIRESPFWTIHLYMCDGGLVRNLDVKAHGDNNDGIDFEMSRNFLVEDCSFDQGDDAVVIKAGRNQDAWRLNTPCEPMILRSYITTSSTGIHHRLIVTSMTVFQFIGGSSGSPCHELISQTNTHDRGVTFQHFPNMLYSFLATSGISRTVRKKDSIKFLLREIIIPRNSFHGNIPL